MANASINAASRNLRLDLGNLPPGTHVFSDSFKYGGVIKFHGSLSGWQKGMWGLSLPVHGKGSISLPVHAAEGHEITDARVQWHLAASPESIGVKLYAVSEDSEEHLLAERGARFV